MKDNRFGPKIFSSDDDRLYNSNNTNGNVIINIHTKDKLEK